MLTHVTFTGWDRHTDLAELAEFLEACPQSTVEIAVLHSSSKDDDDRYPLAKQAAEILRTAKASGQRTALHLCGRAAREMLDSATTGRDASRVNVSFAVADLIHFADRVQANVHEGFWTPGPEKYLRAYEAAYALGRPVIVQSRDLNGWPDVRYFSRGAERMVPFLFDRSGGRGEAPDLWPEVPPDDMLVGYAGGLGPDNVSALVAKIAETRPHARFWIDMESGIREAFPDGFDEPGSFVSIVKCRHVFDAVAQYMERPC
jgi:hypothetical protein